MRHAQRERDGDDGGQTLGNHRHRDGDGDNEGLGPGGVGAAEGGGRTR